MIGKRPFSVRLDTELHRLTKVLAAQKGVTLEAQINQALYDALPPQMQKKVKAVAA